MGSSPAELESHVLDAARSKLVDLAALIHQRFGVAAAPRVVAGALLAELARESDALAAGLLVCGAKGESVIRHFVLGTTALRVLSTTRCPCCRALTSTCPCSIRKAVVGASPSWNSTSPAFSVIRMESP